MRIKKEKSEPKQRIIEAATKLFIEKGVDQTTVRDISTLADVNLAMINYYFSSKEVLPDLIIQSILEEISAMLKKVFSRKGDLTYKIKKMVDVLMEYLLNHPDAVLFFFSYFQRNPERIIDGDAIKGMYNPKIFEQLIKVEIKSGSIKKVNSEQLYLSILSLIIFPFAVTRMIADKNKFTSVQTKKFLNARKKIIVEMILSYVQP